MAAGAIALFALCYTLISPNYAAQAQQAADTPTPVAPQDDDGGSAGGAIGQADPESTPTPPSDGGVSGQTGLAKPTGFTGVGANGSIRLDWNDVAGATSYEVQQWDGHVSPARWRTLPFTSNRTFTIRFSGSSAVVGGHINGTNYGHRVRSKNGSAYSAWTYRTTAAGIRPSIPTGFTSAGGNNTIRLDWNDAANATGYEVQQWDGHVSPARWRTLPFTSNRAFTIRFSGSSAVVGGLITGTSYAHAVRSKGPGVLRSSWTSYITTKATDATATPTPTSTATPTPTATATATPTATPTSTPTPTTAPAISASLSPDPSTVNFQPNGQWHKFTVNSSESIKVVVNPSGVSRNVEIATRSAGNYCPAEGNDTFIRSNGQSIYLAGCRAGTGVVELRRASNNRLIRTYRFTIGASPTATPIYTATATPTPTPTNTPQSRTAATPTPSPKPPRISVNSANPTLNQRIVLSVDQPTGGNAHHGNINWTAYQKCLDNVQSAADCRRWWNIAGWPSGGTNRYYYCRYMRPNLTNPRSATERSRDNPGFDEAEYRRIYQPIYNTYCDDINDGLEIYSNPLTEFYRAYVFYDSARHGNPPWHSGLRAFSSAVKVVWSASNATATPTPTATATGTATATPTATGTPTPTPTNTSVPESDATATPTPTATATGTPTPTGTPTGTGTPTPTPTNTSIPEFTTYTWTTTLRSQRRSGVPEYGYQKDVFGSIGDDEFSLNDTTYRINYLKWNDSANEVKFQLDKCLKPSELISLQLGSRKFDSPDSVRRTDTRCDRRRSDAQEFEFDSRRNPLGPGLSVSVTLKLRSIVDVPAPTSTPTPTGTSTPTPTPTPTNTSVSGATATPTPTLTPTNTSISGATATPTPTGTATATPTPTATPTEWTTITSLLGELHREVSADYTYTSAQTALLSCMNSSSGASGQSATSYSSFDDVLDNYTGSVKTKMESGGTCATQATAMFSALRTVSQSELADLKRNNTRYAALLNTELGRDFAAGVGAEHVIKLFASAMASPSTGGASGAAVDPPPTPQLGINCLAPNANVAAMSLTAKLEVLNCLVFDTPHTFWRNQPKRKEDSQLYTLQRYRALLGYENWDCTFVPDDVFLSSCLMHDVSWDTLRKVVGGVTSDDIDSAWNARNKYAADTHFLSRLLKDAEERGHTAVCPREVSLIGRITLFLRSQPYLGFVACKIYEASASVTSRAYAMYYGVSAINSKRLDGLLSGSWRRWEITDEIERHVADNPHFVEYTIP